MSTDRPLKKRSKIGENIRNRMHLRNPYPALDLHVPISKCPKNANFVHKWSADIPLRISRKKAPVFLDGAETSQRDVRGGIIEKAVAAR
jgi:hypothetical protein